MYQHVGPTVLLEEGVCGLLLHRRRFYHVLDFRIRHVQLVDFLAVLFGKGYDFGLVVAGDGKTALRCAGYLIKGFTHEISPFLSDSVIYAMYGQPSPRSTKKEFTSTRTPIMIICASY
jgi:hypothetical protein